MLKKKSLGQNFLTSKAIAKSIAEAGSPKDGECIIEIGPGEGFLTEEILKLSNNLVLVEKDHRLIPVLEEKFDEEIENKKLRVIEGDILEMDTENLNINEEYKIIANIPYYITGQIIRKFLESNNQPKSMTLLVQKEVAERILARDGKESLLSLSVKIFGNPKIIKKVPRGAFNPVPNVDSAVINIESISKDKLEGTSPEKYFKILHAGFAHKRKQLLPNISNVFDKDKTKKAFEDLGIDPKIRAEDLPISTWVKLSKILV